ncbi:MAG: xanthine dehydrogenase family protein molybdopterin-binding subunit [Candidatus Binatia bacterium]
MSDLIEVIIEGRTFLVGKEDEGLQLEGQTLKQWSSDMELAVLGKPVPRIVGREIVTGRAKFAFDVQLPNMLHAKILRSPYAHARIVGIDLSPAEKHPGVKAVLDHRCPENVLWGEEPRPLFPDEVKFIGEEVAAVAAVDEMAAEEAVDLIRVEYEVLPSVVEMEEATKPGSIQVHPQGNFWAPKPYERGNLEKGLAEAEIVYEQSYRTPFQHHACIEMHGCVADWKGDQLTVWDSGQGVHMMKEMFAKTLGLPEEKVRVLCTHTGGGFGSKLRLKGYHLVAAFLSKKTGLPVRCFMDREEEFVTTRHRPQTIQSYKAGIKRDGTITALHHKALGQGGPYADRIDRCVRSGEQTRELYRCENVKWEGCGVFTHTGLPESFRAPGGLENTYSLEQFVDELAEETGMDPIDFRMKNYALFDQVRNRPYSSKSLERCYREGANLIGWKRRTDPEYHKEHGGKKRGIGMSSVWWHTRELERSEGVVRIHPDGTVELLAGISDFGTGGPTIFSQIVAEEMGVPLEMVKMTYGDSSYTPYSVDGSLGSKTTYLFGPAARNAAAHAKRQLLTLVAQKLEAREDDLEIREGRIFVRGNPARFISFREAAALMGDRPIEGTGRRQADVQGYSSNIFGAHFAEVEVNTETGGVRVIRAVCVQDSGRWLNPLLMESQIHGGFLQGMSMTLMEERAMDREDGIQHNANLCHYHILTSMDIPEEMVIMRVEDREIINNVNAKGTGEVGLIGAGGAIANAISNAVGVRFRDFPITPDKVLRALGKVGLTSTLSLGGFST